MHQHACDYVYFARIRRGNEAYSFQRLGALGSGLGAVACFFELPWSCVSSALADSDQAWLFNEAAIHLRAIGRLTEALEAMRAGLDMGVKQENWAAAAVRASNLSELELTLGFAVDAVVHAEQSVTYADRTDDAFRRCVNRTTVGNTLHHAGRRDEAETYFRQAEQMQVEGYPLLYSLPGFHYCALLLAAAERAAWAANQKAEVATTEELVAACRALRDAAFLRLHCFF
jgi:tetratricopeptide (TPR) repeat protein